MGAKPAKETSGIGGNGHARPQIANEEKGCKGPYDIVNSSVINQWPFDYIKFNQYFSYTHPGDDLFATLREPIHSVGYGFVSKSEFMLGGYGNYVVIDHKGGWQTLYGHMDEPSELKLGDYVYPGMVIGYAGSTGRSTGVHLHFEVMKHGCYYDPRTVIDGSY